MIEEDELIHSALAHWVTRHVPHEHKNPCITLANIDLPIDGENAHCDDGHIDITVRPIVYSNHLLFEMFLGLLKSDEEGDESQ